MPERSSCKHPYNEHTSSIQTQPLHCQSHICSKVRKHLQLKRRKSSHIYPKGSLYDFSYTFDIYSEPIDNASGGTSYLIPADDHTIPVESHTLCNEETTTENRPEGINTLVQRLDQLNVDVREMADRRAKKKQTKPRRPAHRRKRT